MEAPRLLAEIIAQNAPVSLAQFRLATAFKRLFENGFVEEVGVVQSVHCDDCCQPHDAQVVFEFGQYGIYCPELGFTAKQRSELAAIQPRFERLVENLADCLDCKRRKSSPIDGQTWRVGVVSGPSADVAVYFQPTMRDANDVRSLNAALVRETKPQYGVLLTAFGDLSCPPLKTLSIHDCLSYSTAARQFDFDLDIMEVAGAPSKQTGGRPSPYKHALPKIIEDRKKAGIALSGVNEEARAIQAVMASSKPNLPTPAISTIKRAIADT